jgi:hypothetical protein
MPVYTVHGKRSPDGDIAMRRDAADDRIVLVRDGFHFWAFAMTILWLIVHRLWWGLLGYIVLSFGVMATLSSLGISGGARLAVMLVLSLLVGFEASSLRRWSLSRGKWRQLDVIVAEDVESAERRFFDRRQMSLDADRNTPDRGATRDYLGPPRPVAQRDIIGLFPQPGMPR